ncbi:hypothetical protein [Paenibacillus contaminans]|uniref:DUF4355 domain-containing protein n=1 Tax=Paenibacillus contaminans TaxID=450362 RepID=A0A329MQJ5_9BACL|nr:hypothetical protein [Paenibacillus contaminans]RAV22209.1 hypothetical protein DQG23_04455 [Paenibacillus contaminans]
MKQPINMNLQLFAGETSVEMGGVTFEIDPSELQDRPEPRMGDDGSIEIDEEREGDEDERFDEDEEELHRESGSYQLSGEEHEDRRREEEVKPEKDNSAAKAAIAERKKWQAKLEEEKKKSAATEKLMKLVGVTSLDDLQAKLDAVQAQRIAQESGITPQQAQVQVQQQRELEEMRRDIRNQKFEAEATRLKTDPFFADIDHYREEYQEIAERTGQSLEDVYWAKRGRERMKEREREIEQTLQANRSKKQAAKVDTSVSGGTKQKPKSTLTPDQMAIAKLAGMKPEEYAKYIKK